MAQITAAELNSVLDAAIAFYRAVYTGYNNGATHITGLKNAILAMADIDPIAAIVTQVKALSSTANPTNQAAGTLNPILAALQGEISRYQIAGVSTLEDFLSSLNPISGTKWQALQSNYWTELGPAFNPSAVANRWNVYFEVLQGATYANALRKLVIGTGQTAGFTIASTYAGGFGYLLASGITGSDVVTVTGTQFDPTTRTETAGKTWTATVTGNGSFLLAPGGATPAATDSLIIAGSGIVAGGGLSAGTIYLEGRRPSGRPLIS